MRAWHCWGQVKAQQQSNKVVVAVEAGTCHHGWPNAQHMVMPPSMAKHWPVMYAAAGAEGRGAGEGGGRQAAVITRTGRLQTATPAS